MTQESIAPSTTNTQTGEHDIEHAVAELCVRVPVAAGATGLAQELARTLARTLTRTLSHSAPELGFRNVLSRGGWYRLGGVVDAAGVHVADDLVQWAENELATHGDDLHALVEHHADSGLRATLLIGKTHYLVASTGTRAVDFLQIEIEELQEVASHVLFDGDEPINLEELYSPPREAESKVSPQALGLPFFSLRKLTNIADFLARMAAQKPEPQTVHRFFDAWQSSSAGHATQFHNHWVLAVREHLDRYRQPILQATPVPAINGLAPKFESVYGAQGLVLNQALQRFDRQAGYPMAWFFHLLITKRVPHAVANAVIEDVQAGFHYLPERDVKVVKDWLHRPYGF